MLWDEDEIPDPLRLYPGADRVIGYPITLHVYGEEGSLTLLSAQLLGPNNMPLPAISTPRKTTRSSKTRS